ncbi:phage portal protein [Treponema socranskii]|uniref:phage portal protein n=1 Tax=Treponema socranskii TaxID=53419 RepID=UPI0028EB8FAE|nr:phage portal protein [Treponema socranskii]
MNILNLFRSYSIEQITGIETNITGEMYERISLWADMVAGRAPWNDKAPPCGILEQIAGRLNNLVSREIGLEVENDAIAPPMYHLNDNVDKVVEYIALLGGCVIRPVFSNSKLQYEAIPLGNYLPTRYDFDGTLTGALIMKNIIDGTKKFLLTEEHSFDGVNHTVKCTLYANEGGALRLSSLAACAQTANITPVYTWQNVAQPMIIEFRNHAVNKIDGSNVPVALIAGVENLIKDADEQYERMNWEQKAGEARVWADRDMFMKRTTRDGKTLGVQMTKELNRLVTMIDGDGSAEGKKIIEHTPALRTDAQNAMLQQIFRRIELSSNIGKGTISDAEAVQQTATQYTGGRQELYAIVDRIEDEIKAKYQLCANVFAYMAAAYGIGQNDATITVTWNDDQTRKDMSQAKLLAINEINAGIKSKWEYRHDFYGEDEATAKANVPIPEAAPDPFNFGV